MSNSNFYNDVEHVGPKHRAPLHFHYENIKKTGTNRCNSSQHFYTRRLYNSCDERRKEDVCAYSGRS